MYDRKRYDTGMRDPHRGRGKDPLDAPKGTRPEPRLPKEAQVLRRPEERHAAKRPETPAARSVERAPPPKPKPLPRTAPRPRRRPARPAFATFLVVSTLSTVVGLGSKACTSDGPERDPRPRGEPHFVVSRPPEADETPATAWRRHLPLAARDRISGALFLEKDVLLPHVEVVQVEGAGRGRSALTDEHGIFRFDDLAPGPYELQVRGVLDLGLSTLAPSFAAAGDQTRIDVPRWHALCLRRGTDASLHADAVIHAAQTNGGTSGAGTWPSGRTGAVVTGLAAADFYDVLVQIPDTHRACLLERLSPGQDVSLELGPVATVHGRVVLPPGASEDGLTVVLSHGGLRVDAERFAYGGFQAKNLPQGSWWDVTAVVTDANGVVASARKGVTAGEDGRIELKPR